VRREAKTTPQPRQIIEEPMVIPALPPEPASEKTGPFTGRDAALEAEAREILDGLGLHEGVAKLRVVWNPKLRSTAGYAKWPQWLIELNPRLHEFAGQIHRTLKHELAHLIAYARAGRRRIDPHGPEWQKACALIGIPDESARHTLPLPRSQQERKFTYQCPSCGFTVARVRKFRRHTACLACCRKHNRGRYDVRFQFVLQSDRKQK
jgi:SprT protein